jgi:hypothetical protein
MCLSTILKNNPNLHGVLFDLPYATESAKKLYAKESPNLKDNNDTFVIVEPRSKAELIGSNSKISY